MMTEFSSALLHERYVRIDHRSGLPIYVFPKKMTSSYAFFATKYGSVNQSYRDGDGAVVELPDGVAHFLEHKLFDNGDQGDAFERFAALGVDANAYTTYNRTAYLFSGTEHFDEALSELLYFVTHPYFTEQSVKKEQGIIEQEICEYEDSPWEKCFQLVLESMYQRHPVRKKICGSAESIAQITPQLLYDCHRVFYDLSNMALVVCGDVTPEQVLAVAERVLPSEKRGQAPIGAHFEEPQAVCCRYAEQFMAVSKPIFSIGIKDPFIPTDSAERFRRDTALSLMDEILFSRAGRFYNELFEEGIITPSFGGGYSCAEDFGFHCISGESENPELVMKKLKEYLASICEGGISEEEFERCKRVLYADELRAYDSTEEIAGRLLSFVFDGIDMFSYLSVLQSITKEELESFAKEAFQEQFFTLSVVYPLKAESRKEII